jgi:hypothetical protein
MGSVSSTSPALLNLLQSVATDSPQFSSILSMPNVQSALRSASPGDLVQLSDQALELQQVGELFGTSDGTQSSGFTSTSDYLFPGSSSDNPDTEPNLMLQALQDSVALPGTTASAASASQVQPMEGLFGVPSTAASLTAASLIDTLG